MYIYLYIYILNNVIYYLQSYSCNLNIKKKNKIVDQITNILI